jgi:hypothetical protein
MKTKIIFPVLFLTCLLMSSFYFGKKEATPLQLSVQYQSTTPGNADGQIQLEISGGVPPYQILLVSIPEAHTKLFSSDPHFTASALKKGKYQVHVSDATQKTLFKEVSID